MCESLSRRDMLVRTAAVGLGLGLAGLPFAASAKSKSSKVLFFSKSSGYEHSVIHRNGSKLSFAEEVLSGLASANAVQFTFSKDGSLFTPEYVAGFDAFVFYTTGDLTTEGTDKNRPMTAAGKQALLDAIHGGKGFVGVHSATDTFHSKEVPGAKTYQNDGDATDPYVQMLGGEFIKHGNQQKATQHVCDAKFPGMPTADFSLFEEWYSLKNIASDLHVLLSQDTQGMEGNPYKRPPYPSTWARHHGKGRVFYTSMGHREDVWTSSVFQSIVFGGLHWAAGQKKANISADVAKLTPGYRELPPM